MKRNVTIQTKEERTLETVWILTGYNSNFDPVAFVHKEEVTDKKKFYELPSDDEIAQFIHDTKSDYAKLEHIFKLRECDIPFN